MKYLMLMTITSSFSATAFSKEGDFGIDADVTTTGLFPPRLETVTVATVKEGSYAEKTGIKPGDKVASIGGCEIPDCSAFKAQKIMKKEKGEKLEFGIIAEDEIVQYYDLLAE